MQPTPRNKFYMTREDFPSYNDEIARVYRQLHPKEENKEDDMLCKDVTFCVTEACNLACTYCYECHKTSRRMAGRRPSRLLDGLLFRGSLWTTPPSHHPGLIGGEPLLEIELIDKTVEYFKRKAFQLRHPWAYYYMISISTNGVLFENERVQEFIRKNYGHLSIGISIDGDKALHDSCRVFHDDGQL